MAFVLDAETVHALADRLAASALDVTDLLPVPLPDTGTTCDRSDAGLQTLVDRAQALADRLDDQAGTLRFFAPFALDVDGRVAADLTRPGPR